MSRKELTDEARVNQLIERFQSHGPQKRDRASRSLMKLGPLVKQYRPDFVEELLNRVKLERDKQACDPASYEPTQWLSMLVAFEPRNESYADLIIDLSNRELLCDTSVCIDLIGELGVAKPHILDWLAKQFNEFQEHDFDYTYHSDHTRVCYAISKIGMSARSLTPLLVKHIHRRDNEGLDREVLKVLAKLGPAAYEAVPTLEALAAEDEYFDIDDETNCLAVALKSIRGEEK